MKGANQTIKLALEVLTPVHIGSGQELYLNLDYVDKGGQPFVVDQSSTFEAIASGNAALDTVLQGTANLGDLVQLAQAYHGYPLPPLGGKAATVPQTLREHIKDAMLRPYVPGSSLKGAIRTALMAEWLRRQDVQSYQRKLPREIPDRRDPTKRSLSERRQGFAANDLLKHVFGANPNRDLLRALHVSDAGFQQADLKLADIRWLNIVKWSGKERAAWRDMGSRRSSNKWTDTSSFYAETLTPESLAPVVLQWDQFLLSDPQRWQAPKHSNELLPTDFVSLAERLNQHAKHLLQREIAFFERYQQDKPKQQCQSLLNLIEQDSKTAYVRLAWGSGWRGMTGDWQDEKTAGDMRKLYKLGKEKASDFPKTRRLVVQGVPCLPLGWVKLMPWRDEFLQRRSPEPTIIEAKPSHPWVEQQMEQIRKQNNSQLDEVLRGQQLAKAWQALEDAELKQAALADIRSRWQEKGWWENPPGKAAKKAVLIYQEQP